jgi:N-acetylglucosamine kinase-like BadF-type ATPase
VKSHERVLSVQPSYAGPLFDKNRGNQKQKLWEDEIANLMSLYLGIDAGGTKTDCALSNGAELLGQASGPSCKLARVSRAKARENLQSVIRDACDSARVLARDVQHVCIGMAGASIPEAVSWAQETVREIIPGATSYVAGDHIIAHRAAFGTSHGVTVISGTGSIAFGRNPAGETARAGGWGPNVSDEGSAYWVGREAVIAALRAYDLGGSNELLPIIAHAWNVAPEEVIRLANAAEPQFAELGEPIARAAEKGDPSARDITDRAGQALAWLACAVIRRLWPQGGVVPVALGGGVLQGSSAIRQAFKEAMRVKYPEAAISFAYVRPVLGALEIAAQRGRG